MFEIWIIDVNHLSQHMSTIENRSAFRSAFTSGPTPLGMTHTENGALAHNGSGKSTLDFFARVMARDKATAMPDEHIEKLFSESYAEDPAITLKLLAQLRDIRGQGKGERHASKVCWLWLVKNQPYQAYHNMKHLPFYGRWKDLLDFCGTPMEGTALDLMASQLIADRTTLSSAVKVPAPESEDEGFTVIEPITCNVGVSETSAIATKRKLLKDAFQLQLDAESPEVTVSAPACAQITLAAKWAPTENCHEDKVAKKHGRPAPSQILAKILAQSDPSAPEGTYGTAMMRWYRKTYIVPLRKAIGLVETYLCDKDYDKIDFSKVPGVALKIYSGKAFPKHMPERFAQWQSDVLSGKSKMNSNTVDPYEVVSLYLGGKVTAAQKPTLEAFYHTQVATIKAMLLEKYGNDNLEDMVTVIDVSGSMGSPGCHNSAPLCTGIAMGTWISSIVREDWRDLVLTFSSRPRVVDLSHCTGLEDRIDAISKCDGHGTSTNLQALFDLILERAQGRRLTPEQMPKRMVIVSDMEFDVACPNGSTNLEVARAKYLRAGYTLPIIVFWNVRGNTTSGSSPATHDDRGIIMLSGQSKSLMTALLEGGDVPTPYDMMLKILSDPRYERMQLA
jgi:hypothetical protein